MRCALGLPRRIRPLTQRDVRDGVLQAEDAEASGAQERRPFREWQSRHSAELTNVQRRHLATSLPATSAVAATCGVWNSTSGNMVIDSCCCRSAACQWS